LSQDSQVGVPKLLKLRFLQLLSFITLHAGLRLKWGPKQNCSPRQELSNGLSNATYTQGNQVNSWFFVVKSQIANLNPSPSFGHNLCFKCPNGSYEPILNIYASRAFQWYKEIFKPLSFDPCNRLQNSKVHRDSISQSGSCLGSVKDTPALDIRLRPTKTWIRKNIYNNILKTQLWIFKEFVISIDLQTKFLNEMSNLILKEPWSICQLYFFHDWKKNYFLFIVRFG
jgi:hypothetical protein